MPNPPASQGPRTGAGSARQRSKVARVSRNPWAMTKPSVGRGAGGSGLTDLPSAAGTRRLNGSAGPEPGTSL